MATSTSKYAACKLVEYRTLKLKTEAGREPDYNGVVVTDDTLLVIDRIARNFKVYSHDGKLLYTSHELESTPIDVCLISKTEFAVCLYNSKILILSLKSVDDVKLVKTFDVMTGFDGCHSVAKWNSDKLVVSGWKWDDGWMLYWCVVNLTDGRVDSTHYICKWDIGWSWTHLAIKNNTVYISCWTYDSITNGVCAYDIFNPHTHKFLYQHHDRWSPGSVMADERNFIYVIDLDSNSIHQLTDSGQLVTIHTVSSSLDGIFYDDQHGVLYTTSYRSNVITVYRLEYLHQTGIPVEILNMDDRSIQLFEEALKDGKERVFSVRIMVVGHFRVGKTTLVKRLLGEEVNISDRRSTEGIDVCVNCGDVSLSTHEWTRRTKDSEQDYRLQHLARVLNEQQSMKDKAMREEQVKILPQGEITHRYDVAHIADEDKESDVLYSSSPQQDISHDLSSTASQKVKSSPTLAQREPIQSETNIIAMLKLLQENVCQIKQETDKTLPLTLLDLADEYAFYTTHQMFQTSRAIYLLVSDVSKQLTELVADECYFDCDGKIKCKVHEVIEFWLNSIHYCTPSPSASIPPVILVGTHVDKMSQSGHFEIQEICKKYFREIRTCLENEPSRFHLVNEEFAIDNTVVDKRLEDLKTKILEVASQQPYCHVEIPARWIALEQKLMRLKEAGVKVIPISLLKEMNRTGVVPLSAEELDLFLRFQHAIGTILYFSLDVLREKIVLEPQWLIDALKSLINADKMFILHLTKAVTEKWFEFKTKGKLFPELIGLNAIFQYKKPVKTWKEMLTHEKLLASFFKYRTQIGRARDLKPCILIGTLQDAIWTKERNQDFYVSKEYLLRIMEQLNIIAKPRSYTKDGKDIKQEDYYLVPCMLRQAMPKEMISPESDPERESTSVLCFMYTGNILPPPIFHKLVGACLIHWPIAKQWSENHIYCGCCLFDLGHHHRLTLYFRGNIIFARVSRMGVKDATWTSQHCRKARELIFENLSKIFGNQGESLPFVPHVKCLDSDPNSLEGLIAVSLLQGNEYVVCDSHEKSHELFSTQLLQYWFEEERSTVHKPADIFSASSKYKKSIKESEKTAYLTERDIRKEPSEYITAPRSKFERSTVHKPADIFSASSKYKSSIKESEKSAYLTERDIRKEPSEYITSLISKFERSTVHKPADIFSASSKYKSSIKESEKSAYLTERDIRKEPSEYITARRSTLERSTVHKPADIFSASSKYKSSIKESEKSAYLTERDIRKEHSEYITARRSKFEQKMDLSQEIHSKLSDLTIHEEYKKSLQRRTLPPEMSAEWNFTVKELNEAWQSVEVYLLEELYPKSLLNFFEKISFLSAEECEDICNLRRRQVVKELLQRMKAKLPEAFSSFLQALNETKQDVVMQGLRKQIEGTRGPKTMTHDEESNVGKLRNENSYHVTSAMVSSLVYYKMKLELLKDGCIMHETESETRAYLDNGRILFYYNMRSHCLTVETGSIVICLRPMNNLTKEGLLFFVEHDGIGDFISDLLKRKSIFKSLPDGEMSIHVQVYCYDKDSQSEGADGQNRGYTQVDLHESFTVTDNPQMIKKNLNLQYDSLVEEIDPLFFKDMFIARGILDRNFFEKLRSLKRRERASHFLKTVTDKGSTALAVLIDALRNSELDDLANDLCTIRDNSSQFTDEGQVDASLLKVVQEDSETHGHESKLWSGLFTVTVGKNEEGTDRQKRSLDIDQPAPAPRISQTYEQGIKRQKSSLDQPGPEPRISQTGQQGGKRQNRSLDINQPGPGPGSSISQTNQPGALGSITSDSVMKQKEIQAKKKHRHLCLALHGQISEDSFKNIKQMAQVYLDRITVEKAKDMRDLWSCLEEKGVISVGKYDELIEIMTYAGVGIVINEIQQTAKAIKDIMQTRIPGHEQSEMSSLDAHT